MVQVHIILFCNFCSPDGELQLRRGILQIFIDGKLEIDGIVTRIQTLRSDLRNIPLHGSATSLLVVNPRASEYCTGPKSSTYSGTIYGPRDSTSPASTLQTQTVQSHCETA